MSKKALFLIVLLMLVSGCLGGEPSIGYSLIVTVTDQISSEPIPGALVEIAGGVSENQLTNEHGQATFSNLNGAYEVIVSSAGYEMMTTTVTMNQNRTVPTALTPLATVVTSPQELAEAVDDVTVNTISLGTNIEADLAATRLVNLDLNGYILTGQVSYVSSAAGTLMLAGDGRVEGDLSVDTPNAAVTNALEVSGEVHIIAVAPNTWTEQANGNKLLISTALSRIIIELGADEVTVEGPGNTIEVNGPVKRFVALSHTSVSGSQNIKKALVDAEGVTFDVPPEEIDENSTHQPDVLQPFQPGEGGPLPSFAEFFPVPGHFGGIRYVQSDRQLPHLGGSPRNVVEIRFYSPDSLGVDSLTLQYSTDSGQTWSNYTGSGDNDLVTTRADQDNFVLISPGGSYTYRLKASGGEFHGSYSNAVHVPLSTVNTRFMGWGLSESWDVSGVMYPFVGRGLQASFSVRDLTENEPVDTEDLSYQWYRLNPLTLEREPIVDAKDSLYITTAEDVGYHLLIRATGDGSNIGGISEIYSSGRIVYPNPVFFSDISPEGVTINFFQNMPGFSIDDFELTGWPPAGGEIAPVILGITKLDDSRFRINTELVAGVQYELVSTSDFWTFTSDGGHGHMGSWVTFEF